LGSELVRRHSAWRSSGTYSSATYHAGLLKDINNVVHGNIPAEKLLPNLNTNTAKGPLPNPGAKESEEGDILGLMGNPSGFLDLFVLNLYDGIVTVSVTVQKGKRFEGFFPSFLAGEPAGGFGEEG
jgi:hypothetical protein